jgi:hypothetical protein
MIKIKLLAISLLILSLPVCADAQNLATTIKVQAMKMGSAVINNDFNTFVKFMHPNIVDFAGGEKQMKSKMDSAYQAMKRFKLSFKRYWIGSPGEIVSHNNQLQALLPQSTTIQTSMGEITVETTMIVISNDGGKNWWFIDTNVYKAEKLKNTLPDLSPKLVIPPQKKPKIVPKKLSS